MLKSYPKQKAIKLSPARYKKLVAVVLSRDNYSCRVCGERLRDIREENIPPLHHIKLKSQGGSDTLSNLLTVCHSCHESIHRSINGLSVKYIQEHFKNL